MKEIRLHGRGGQGVVKASQIVVRAAVAGGKNGQFIPFFGVERKGSPVFGYLRISEEPIRRKMQVYEPEILVIMDDSLVGLPATYTSYTPPTVQTGGCYVATAVYGSYDCPEVWTLRRFRDNTLAETWYGRAFIRTYYAISPTLVKWFGETAWFKNMWKPTLDRMVERLNGEGVENTPYNDREW